MFLTRLGYNSKIVVTGDPTQTDLLFGKKSGLGVAAKILKNEDSFGTVECGKIADLVLLRSNPLEDLRNITQVQSVFLGGEVINEKWMCNLR